VQRAPAASLEAWPVQEDARAVDDASVAAVDVAIETGDRVDLDVG
jgi:hypothetical protein